MCWIVKSEKMNPWDGRREKNLPAPCAKHTAARLNPKIVCTERMNELASVSDFHGNGWWKCIRMTPVMQCSQVLPDAKLI